MRTRDIGNQLNTHNRSALTAIGEEYYDEEGDLLRRALPKR